MENTLPSLIPTDEEIEKAKLFYLKISNTDYKIGY